MPYPNGKTFTLSYSKKVSHDRKKPPFEYPDAFLLKIAEEEIVYALDRHQTVTLLMGAATNADKIEIAGIHSNHIAKMECASTFPH